MLRFRKMEVSMQGAVFVADHDEGRDGELTALIAEVEYRGSLALYTPEGQGGADR